MDGKAQFGMYYWNRERQKLIILNTLCYHEMVIVRGNQNENYHGQRSFNRKISLLISKLNKSGRNSLGVVFGALLYMAERPGY